MDLIDAVKGELDAAQGVQEAGLAGLPIETLKVYEAKGRLLDLIEKMNRRGKIAFDGQAHILALFNKDLVLRARTKRRATSTVEAVGDVEGEEVGWLRGAAAGIVSWARGDAGPTPGSPRFPPLRYLGSHHEQP